jgi:hypothetical protein
MLGPNSTTQDVFENGLALSIYLLTSVGPLQLNAEGTHVLYEPD